MGAIVTPMFAGKVQGGEIKHFQADAWMDRVRQFEGKRIFAALDMLPEKRSLRANAYYWFMLQWVCDNDPQFIGWTKNQLHVYFGLRFDPVETGDPEIPFMPGPTHNMNKERFAWRIQQVQLFESEHGILVPTPEDYVELKRKRWRGAA